MAGIPASSENRPTGGRRRKTNSPLCSLPERPPLSSGLETLSDDLEEEKGELKRLRSTTPRSEPLRARIHLSTTNYGD